ncbi:hypothetical protein FHX41_0823 [Actinomadura hallensis]|uniref:Uncharacterized protein n=1 Tax=Actinomadura hallensis TaxID=337895 RepID=A0A543I9F9_9ACTN|nr:DUF6177 family protein [Actinomadura hallensis]TQM67218.1 hypothetical protein FHX41_0823 [Actinomadura hallensis]
MSTVDALTDQAMVVLQDRPLVPLSAWLNKALGDCAASGRTLQLVTPLESRLSLPLRTAASGNDLQWVVRHGDGYYEGLTGRPLKWGGATFVPVPEARDYAPGYTTRPTAPIGAQLTLVYRTRHGAEGDLGGPVERLMHLLTGKPPGALGPAEPLEHPWRRDRFTEFARGRSTARLLVVGDGPRPAQAICDFTTGPGGGVSEVSTVTVGYMPEDPPPLRHLPTLVGALAADQTIASLFVQLTPGRADLTTEPRWTGAPAPVALAVAGTVSGPPGIPGQQVGPPRAPLTFFPLGDGRSQDGWQRHSHLMQHLTSA